MSTGKGYWLANKVLDATFGGVPFTTPAVIYMALYAVSPGADGGGVEFAGGNYARVAVTNDSTSWSLSSQGQKISLRDITFPGASANLGTAVAAAFLDAPSGGNLLVWGTLQTATPIFAGQIPIFPAGSITLVEQ